MADNVTDQLLTDSELQAFLGISRTTLWRLRKMGGLPYGKVGREYRYRRDDIVRWVMSQRDSGNPMQLRFSLDRISNGSSE